MVEIFDTRERAVMYQIVGGLEIEGLLNFGVWRDEEMEEDEGWDEERQENV